MTYVSHKVTRKNKKARQRQIHADNLRRRDEQQNVKRAAPIPIRVEKVKGFTSALDLFYAYQQHSRGILSPFKPQDNRMAMLVRNSGRTQEGRKNEALFHHKNRRIGQARKLQSVSGRAGRMLQHLANLQEVFITAAHEKEERERPRQTDIKGVYADPITGLFTFLDETENFCHDTKVSGMRTIDGAVKCREVYNRCQLDGQPITQDEVAFLNDATALVDDNQADDINYSLES